MADLTAFKRDLLALIEQGAPQEDIDAFFDEEGITRDDKAVSMSRMGKDLSQAAEAMQEGFYELAEHVQAVGAVLTGELAAVRSAFDDGLGAAGSGVAKSLADMEARMGGEHIKGRSALEKRVGTLEKKLDAIATAQAGIQGMFEKLMTARRVPVRDGKGQLIGVELETNS